MWTDILKLVSAHPALAALATGLLTAVMSAVTTHWLTIRRTRRVDEREHLMAALKAKDEELKSLRAKHELDVQLRDESILKRVVGALSKSVDSSPKEQPPATRPKKRRRLKDWFEALKLVREELSWATTFDAGRLIEEEPLAGFVAAFPNVVLTELCRRFTEVGERELRTQDAKELRHFLFLYETSVGIAGSLGLRTLRRHVEDRDQPLDDIFADELKRARLGEIGDWEPIMSVHDIAPKR